MAFLGQAVRRGLRLLLSHRLSVAVVAGLLAALAVSNSWRVAPLTVRGLPPATAVEMVVEDLRVEPRSRANILVLKEKRSPRYLTMAIGDSEARAIARELAHETPRRPMTHDLLQSVVGRLGAKVVWVVVTDFADDVYYAQIVMERGGGHLALDSRPSDAIALALRAQAGIYAERTVLDRAGIAPPTY